MKRFLLPLLLLAGAASAQPLNYWVNTSGSGGPTCTTPTQPCLRLQTAVDSALSSSNRTRNSIQIHMAAGTYPTDRGIMDLDFTALMDRGGQLSDLEIIGTPIAPTLGSGAAATGTCTFSTAARPTRVTCTSLSGGTYTASEMAGMFVRLGNTSPAFPEGTCGTWGIQDNTTTALTVNLTATAAQGYTTAPAGCTGTLRYAILVPGTIITGFNARPPIQAWPPFAAGLPDGGSLNDVTAIADTLPVQWAISSAGAHRQNNFNARWVEFKPAHNATGLPISVRLNPGASATFQNIKCSTEFGALGAGTCFMLMGGDQHVSILRSSFGTTTGATGTGSAVAIRDAAHVELLKGFNNVLVGATGQGPAWFDFRGPVNSLRWGNNYAKNCPGALYNLAGVPNGFLSDDVIVNNDGTVTTGVIRQNVTQAISLHDPVNIRIDAVNWTGQATTTGGFGVISVYGFVEMDPNNVPSIINYPNASGGVFTLQNQTNVVMRTANSTLSSRDAGFLASFWDGIASLGKTAADIDAGYNPATAVNNKGLCNQQSYMDGCIRFAF